MVKFITIIVVVALMLTVVFVLADLAKNSVKTFSNPKEEDLQKHVDDLKTKITTVKAGAEQGSKQAQRDLDKYNEQLLKAESLLEKTKHL